MRAAAVTSMSLTASKSSTRWRAPCGFAAVTASFTPLAKRFALAKKIGPAKRSTTTPGAVSTRSF